MSSKKRKEEERRKHLYWRVYRFFVPADFKESFNKGSNMVSGNVYRGMQITGERHPWMRKLPLFGGLFK